MSEMVGRLIEAVRKTPPPDGLEPGNIHEQVAKIVPALPDARGEPAPVMLRRGEADAEGSEDNTRTIWQAILREAPGQAEDA